MPDYTVYDPKGWCGDPRRGAAMGRPTVMPEDRLNWDGKLFLRRVRLNSGGYDCNGTYFGLGDPLYWAADADGTVDFMTRATDREDAKTAVLQLLPNARFFR